MEIRWFEEDPGSFEDTLIQMQREGTFKRFLPNCYKRGILWCGHCWQNKVYPVTESEVITPNSREIWRRSTRYRLFYPGRYSRR